MRNTRYVMRSPSPHLQAGMSLMEIIVVILLIGMVMTFVGSRVLGGADRGKTNIARSQVMTLANKVEAFQMDTGRLPASLDNLVSDPGNTPGWLGPYSKPAELKDPWGHAVLYTVPGQTGEFDIVILGKDGEAGGTSVDADIRYE